MNSHGYGTMIVGPYIPHKSGVCFLPPKEPFSPLISGITTVRYQTEDRLWYAICDKV